MNRICLAAALSTILASGAVHAQFGDLLKNAITNAATNAATSAAAHATTNAVNGAIREATSPSAPAPAPASPAAPSPARPATGTAPEAAWEQVPASAARPGCESTRKRKPLPPLGPRPANFPAALWPTEPACAYGFEDYDFTGGKEQARAFEQAGRVACSECAGGFSHDANAQGKLAVSGGLTKRFLEMLVTMQPGEQIAWQGARYRGAITLTGELPIGEFPCRQFRWTLTNKADVVMAERDGLYCIWKYRSDDPVWHKVL
ncbi:hypothetical protein OU994_06060 [Pseudoduganella sp. SL102]|uniref:hypothetical protein n=1 Tax=Pseudoduganella sp. SL102 TaxID=2995154 RepID=UPI00248B5F17|nr:hypothetical protein [Pseudoduganella sp. SL102]WBS03850.1 hypothetical protein OU994_06060 [Pseudoduganella sp. SL102]